MFKNILNKYINKLTKEDIYKFGLEQNIILKNNEIDIIYNEIKNNLDNILYNTESVLNKIKDKVEPTTYLKITELIVFYKNKFSNYL